jgi:DNA-binding transcriptional regulator PaaX
MVKREYNIQNMIGNRRIRYKDMSVNMFGLPSFNDSKKKKNVRIKKRIYLRSFISSFRKDAPKNLLLIYDIPEGRKKERDWFRRQLRNFDFTMIQKSVWFGPSPLPIDFLAYLKRIGLQKEFKTFKLAKSYTN